MLRGKRIGLIVWGTILSVGSFALFAVDDEVATYAGIVNLIGAALMIIFGIVNIVSATKFNNIMLSGNTDFIGRCTTCNNEIQCTIKDFRPHGRFPEGFLYCPVCKRPISRNAFRPLTGYRGIPDNPYDNPNGY